jgi:hypothetical protein
MQFNPYRQLMLNRCLRRMSSMSNQCFTLRSTSHICACRGHFFSTYRYPNPHKAKSTKFKLSHFSSVSFCCIILIAFLPSWERAFSTTQWLSKQCLAACCSMIPLISASLCGALASKHATDELIHMDCTASRDQDSHFLQTTSKARVPGSI